VSHNNFFHILTSNSFSFQEGHIAAAEITRTAVRMAAVSFSHPYFAAPIGIISRKPHPLPKFLAIMWPFQYEVWLAVLFALLLMGPVYWIFLQVGPKGPVSSIDDAMVDVLKCLVMQGSYIVLLYQHIMFALNCYPMQSNLPSLPYRCHPMARPLA
jgi:hypothetical protein